MSQHSSSQTLPSRLGLAKQDELGRLVTQALSESHEDLAAAQAVSRQSGQGVYSQIWRSLCGTLISTLKDGRWDVQVIKPGRAPYCVPVVGDALLVPWRPAGGLGPDEVPFGTSPTRAQLWQQPLLPAMLDLADDNDSDGSDDATTPRGSIELDDIFDDAVSRSLRVVLIAITADAQRLHTIEWGEVTLNADGSVCWLSREVLFDSRTSARPAEVTPTEFNAGQPPRSGVRLREQDRSDSVD